MRNLFVSPLRTYSTYTYISLFDGSRTGCSVQRRTGVCRLHRNVTWETKSVPIYTGTVYVQYLYRFKPVRVHCTHSPYYRYNYMIGSPVTYAHTY